MKLQKAIENVRYDIELDASWIRYSEKWFTYVNPKGIPPYGGHIGCQHDSFESIENAMED